MTAASVPTLAFGAFGPSGDTILYLPPPKQKAPAAANPRALLTFNPGSDLLSQGIPPKYHRRGRA